MVQETQLPDDDDALAQQDAAIRQRIRQRAMSDETGLWSIAYMLGGLQGTLEVYVGDALGEILDSLNDLQVTTYKGVEP